MMEVDGLKFHTRPNSWDDRIVYIVAANREYRADIKEGDKVLDIGAHIGAFSVYAASKGATVTAYEPSKDNYKLLVKNIKLNGFEEKITAINKAIGKPRKAKLRVNRENMGSSRLSEEGTETVEVVNPDLNGFDIIKMDCEGCEYEIDIPKCRQLVMELHPPGKKEFIKKLSNRFKVDKRGSNAKNCMIINAKYIQ